ncbi:(2Fe-2S)-binding protein [Shewanella submarina]|uniref:2Fe-2S iron-sulfur cluster-binding protein n=1 Tax=Shewanella submarina TaxID=2016376 RepID=A0ABV7GMK5_9GAMM|nr:2Fe-2S iron-sulfur cluster-binding protein [Shewanella submarina]MCL1039608.1 (2Fe-2S)-binding protein [Shewanella submarina]
MPKVTIAGISKPLEIPSGTSLQELQFEQDVLPFGCCSAACGTCAMEVLNGMENLNPKSEEENDVLDNIDENGHKRRLACQCILTGDITIQPL